MFSADIGSDSGFKNALHGFGQTSGYPRLFFGLLFVFGVLFCGIGIVSVFGALSLTMLSGTESVPWIILLACYAVHNLILSSGFILCRRWLLTAFFGNLVFWAANVSLLFVKSGAIQWVGLLSGIFFSSFFLLFLFGGRRFLVGRYFEPVILSIFLLLLVISFFMNVVYLAY